MFIGIATSYLTLFLVSLLMMKMTQTTLTSKDIINKVAKTATTITNLSLLSSLQVHSVAPSVAACENAKCQYKSDDYTHMLFQIDQRAHYFQSISKKSTCYDLISYIFINSQVQ